MLHAVMVTGQPLSLSYSVATGSQGLSQTGFLLQCEGTMVSTVCDASDASPMNLLPTNWIAGMRCSKSEWPNNRLQSHAIHKLYRQRDRQLPLPDVHGAIARR